MELFTENYERRFKVDEFFFAGRSKYQMVHCFSNKFLGKVLFLDNKIQSAQIDEFVYHESLVHPGLLTHPCPRRVLVVGGGEGATIREVLRHECVERVTMVDIDQKLVEICRMHLPEWSDGAFSDRRTNLVFADARKYIEKSKKKVDVIISDLTEPIDKGPSVYLFTKEFYRRIFDKLDDDGIFIQQAGSVDPCYYKFFVSCRKTLKSVFPIVRPLWTYVFSFGLPWGFVLASKKHDPATMNQDVLARRLGERKVEGLKFYGSRLHPTFFALPLYIEKNLKRGRVLTDDKPYIYEL